MDRPNDRKIVSKCYDHLGGKLGEELFRFLIDKKLISKSNDGRSYDITETGWKEFQRLGIDIDKLHSSKRKIISPCIERSSGKIYEHAGAYLGALLAEYMFDKGWLTKSGKKSYEITEEGLKEIESLGIDSKKIIQRG